jgi:hypothetical protein
MQEQESIAEENRALKYFARVPAERDWPTPILQLLEERVDRGNLAAIEQPSPTVGTLVNGEKRDDEVGTPRPFD